MEYTAAALFEEFYAIEGVNKAASPDSFYRAIEDIVFTPFDYDSERNNINVQEPVVEIQLDFFYFEKFVDDSFDRLYQPFERKRLKPIIIFLGVLL